MERFRKGFGGGSRSSFHPYAKLNFPRPQPSPSAIDNFLFGQNRQFISQPEFFIPGGNVGVGGSNFMSSAFIPPFNSSTGYASPARRGGLGLGGSNLLLPMPLPVPTYGVEGISGAQIPNWNTAPVPVPMPVPEPVPETINPAETRSARVSRRDKAVAATPSVPLIKGQWTEAEDR